MAADQPDAVKVKVEIEARQPAGFDRVKFGNVVKEPLEEKCVEHQITEAVD